MLKDAMGGYRGTATEISRIIAEHPDNAEAYYNRGNARSSCDDYEGAIGDFTMALKIGLRFREAILRLMGIVVWREQRQGILMAPLKISAKSLSESQATKGFCVLRIRTGH